MTSTGVLDSKFGFSIETGDAEKAVDASLSQPYLVVRGLHFHLGSPLFELEPYEEAIEYVCAFAARMKWVHHLEMKEFSPGGGMAIGYLSSKLPPTIGEYAKTITDSLIAACTKYGLDQPRLIIEPGRSIVGRAGVAVYTVGGIKRIPGVRTYVSVDGGMGDNIRPALYDAGIRGVVSRRSARRADSDSHHCWQVLRVRGCFGERRQTSGSEHRRPVGIARVWRVLRTDGQQLQSSDPTGHRIGNRAVGSAFDTQA